MKFICSVTVSTKTDILVKRLINVLSQEIARLCGIDYSEIEIVPGTKVLIEQGTRCNRIHGGPGNIVVLNC